MRALSFAGSALVVGAVMVAACDSDPTAANSTCTTTASCPLGQLCDTVQSACVPEPQDGFAGFFSCTLYDDADHPFDPNGPPSTSDLVGTLGPTRYTFYLDAGCTAYTKRNPPYLELTFDAVALGDESDTLDVKVAWPPSPTVNLARAMVDQQVGSGDVVGDRLDDDSYAPRLGYVTGGQLTLSSAPVPGGTLTGYLDVSADATPSQQPPLLSDCTNVGVAACGQAMGEICSSLGKGDSKSACTFPCMQQGDCDPYGGVCDPDLGACTKDCATAADCPSWLACSAPAAVGKSVCN